MEKDHSEQTGKMAAALAIVEVGLGSLLHSFKIPLSGHLLSINQMAMIARTAFQLKSKKAALEISIVASLLKSLSPAGKKLTPMLAIATQGVLFYVGLSLGGLSVLGLMLAILLASLWAFIQPVLFIYLLFGQTSVEVAAHFLKEMQKLFPHAEQILLSLVIGLYVIKCILAIVACYFSITAKEEAFLRFTQKMSSPIRPKKTLPSLGPFRSAIRDLFNPLFVVSLLLTAFYFTLAEASVVKIIWALLRPIAVGLMIFYFFRVYPIERLSLFLERKGFLTLSKSLNRAVVVMKEMKFLK